jgi:hypothetical protein
MAMQTDVKAVHTEATATIVPTRARIKGYHVISGGTAGDVIFRDGSASGAIVLQFNIGPGTQPIVMLIPGEGILCQDGVHVTIPATSKVTIYYG